jgi:hypothetical protein
VASAPAPVAPSAPASEPTLGPRVITEYEEGDPIPPGYHRSTQVRKGAVIAGAVVFGVLYLLSTLVAAAAQDASPNQSNPVGALWVPGIGPFMQIANTSSAIGNWFLVVDGLGQTGGIALFIYGIASPKPILERNPVEPREARIVPRIIPLGRDGAGLGFTGSF